MAKSIFNGGEDETLRGGLDRYLGPEAAAYSKMPSDLTDGKDADADNPNIPDSDATLSELKEAVDEEATEHGETPPPAGKDIRPAAMDREPSDDNVQE